MEKREEYYHGYLTGIMDVARTLDEEGWVGATETLDKLTREVVRDIIRETQVED